jgi:hypothetical protein
MNGNKTWQRNLLNSAVAASMLFGATVAGAATNGSVGPTSTGSVDLTILVPDLVLVSNLDDITFQHDRVNGASATETFCVWGSPGVKYDLTVSSLSPTGTSTFVASSGTEFIDYTVEFADNVTMVDPELVVESGVMDAEDDLGYTPDTSALPNCGAGDNAAIRISTANTGIGNPPSAGIYEDTLTLVVSPL